ncbi:hypothetical protein [Staphylococcus caprae]|uniref:hypothetical protein n=1 Tax=Staphylococcus caprae TaxID=29380 RepID=UPI001452045A|nr:hypothetical protein [Staphylococcus caprae]QJE26687.1 hypothetical protein HHJ99_13025 [Staphylococcus caprae]
MKDLSYSEYIESLKKGVFINKAKFKKDMKYDQLGRTNRYVLSKKSMSDIGNIDNPQNRRDFIENLMVIAINSDLFDDLSKGNEIITYITEKLNKDFISKAKKLGYANGKDFMENIIHSLK